MIEQVVNVTIYILYTVILIFILILELTLLHLQQFNLIPTFNLVISFSTDSVITNATVVYDNDTFHIPIHYRILHQSAEKIILSDKISQFKFQILTYIPTTSPQLPTIIVFSDGRLLSSVKFIVTRLDSHRYLLNLK